MYIHVRMRSGGWVPPPLSFRDLPRSRKRMEEEEETNQVLVEGRKTGVRERGVGDDGDGGVEV